MSSLSTTQEHCNIHKWLLGVLGQVKLVVPIASVIVHLVEDTGNVDRVVSGTVTAVGSSSTVRDVRFVVRRVNILSVPAALEVLDDRNETIDLMDSCRPNSRVGHEHHWGRAPPEGSRVWWCHH